MSQMNRYSLNIRYSDLYRYGVRVGKLKFKVGPRRGLPVRARRGARDTPSDWSFSIIVKGSSVGSWPAPPRAGGRCLHRPYSTARQVSTQATSRRALSQARKAGGRAREIPQQVWNRVRRRWVGYT